MSQFSSDSQITRSLERVASLRAAADLKRARNNRAAELEHTQILRKLAHEGDDAFGSGGILKRGLAKIKDNSLTVPAERKRELKLSSSGRSFHGRGATYSKERAAEVGQVRKRSASLGAAHYRYIEGPDHDPVVAAAAGGSHISYIDGSRVEQGAEGERLSGSNIEGTFVDRMRFFALAEAFERGSHGDKASFDPNHADERLAAAVTDPRCDPALKEAVEGLALPYNGSLIKVQLEGNNKDLRRLMEDHGIKLSKAKTNDEQRADDGIAFHYGRSGRTHFRWVFELPVEFTAKHRKMVLKGLCKHMEDQKCMYAAVIHEPDPHNDARNHHLHLIFYDRPCRRLRGNHADLENFSGFLKDDLLSMIDAGEIKEGEWDFTVQRRYKSVRTWRTHYPFRAEKSRDITKGKDWQKRFRRDYAAIVNQVSEEAGGSAVYDPRSYSDRDVDLSPSKHLGQLHKSEVAGIPTLIGLGNEAGQSDDQRRALFGQYDAEMARLSKLEMSLEPYRPAGTLDPKVSGWAAKPLADLAEARQAVEAKLALDLWLMETARERSRAELVRDRQRRASNKGSPNERLDRERLATAADVHLQQLDRQDAEMKQIVVAVEQDIRLAPKIADDSIERTALNCETFQRLYPWGGRQAPASVVSEVAGVNQPNAEDQSNCRTRSVGTRRDLNPQEHRAKTKPNPAAGGADVEPASQPMLKSPRRAQTSTLSSSVGAEARVTPGSSMDESTIVATSAAVVWKPLIIPALLPHRAPKVLDEPAQNLEASKAATAESGLGQAKDSAGLPQRARDNDRTAVGPRISARQPHSDLPEINSPDQTDARNQVTIAVTADLASELKSNLVERVAVDLRAEINRPLAPAAQPPKLQRTGVADKAVSEKVGSEAGASAANRDGAQSFLDDPNSDADIVHDAQQDVAPANAGELLREAWINRIVRRHVRLIETNGLIVAAPGQPLDRGDAMFIAQAQADFGSVKARQDSLALEVAKDLWLNADRFRAGQTRPEDALTLELKDQWATDPVIAWAVRHVWGRGTAPRLVRVHAAAFQAGRGEGVA